MQAPNENNATANLAIAPPLFVPWISDGVRNVAGTIFFTVDGQQRKSAQISRAVVAQDEQRGRFAPIPNPLSSNLGEDYVALPIALVLADDGVVVRGVAGL